MGKRIVTEADIRKALDSGSKTVRVKLSECIITPQAEDKALELGVTIIDSSVEEAAPAPAPAAAPQAAAPAPVEEVAKPCAPAACPEAEAVVGQVCTLLSEKLPAGTDAQVLEAVVRRVVFAKLGENGCCEKAPEAVAQPQVAAQPVADGKGICFIEGQRLKQQGSSPVPVDEKVFIADAIGACDNAKLAGGYMEWERASFTRTVETPEIGIILEGELHLTIGGETKIGKAGDMMYFPEGVEVTYGTPTSVRIACVNNIQ